MKSKPIGLEALLEFWTLHFTGYEDKAEELRSQAEEAFRIYMLKRIETKGGRG